MGDNQGQSIFVWALAVDKMYIQAFYRSFKLRPSVDVTFEPAPVVFMLPVMRQFLCIVKRNALVPVATGFRLWPSCFFQAKTQILQLGFRDLNGEWYDFSSHRKAPVDKQI